MVGIRKNTIGMFDGLKGVIVIYVILFHSFIEVWAVNDCTWYPLIWKILNCSRGVAMGTLFIISGYGFRPIKKIKTLKNQVKYILKPYFLAFLCSILLRIPLNISRSHPPFEGAMERILGCLLGQMGQRDIWGYQTESIFVFWYFLALLGGYLLLSLIFRLIRKEIWRGIVASCCVLGGYVLGIFFSGLPYVIIPTLLSVGFLYFGYIMKKRAWLFSNLSFMMIIILSIFSFVALAFGSVDLGNGYLKLGLIDYIGTVCGGFLLLRIYCWLFSSEWKIYIPLMFFGRNSYLIIALHGFENLVFQWRDYSWLIMNSVLFTAFCFFFLRICIILILYVMIKKVKKYLL